MPLPKFPRLECPVLVLGSRDDRVLGGKASEQIAEQLENSPDCELVIYEDYGHAAYDLAPGLPGEAEGILPPKRVKLFLSETF